MIEDHIETRLALEMLLGQSGYTIMATGTMVGAQSLLRAFVIDLVITDLHLPNGSGLEILRSIRDALPHVPVIAITADGDMAADPAIRSAFECVIEKPLDVGLLFDAIHAVQKRA